MKRLLLILLASLTLILPVYAIGEVTPTPPAPEPTAVQPTVVPSLTEDEALFQATQELLNGDYDQVVDILTAFLDGNPDSAEAYVLRGTAYQALARYSLALDDMTRAINLVPYDWTYYVARGDTYAIQGEFGEAGLDYNRAIDLNPRYTTAYYKRAELSTAQGLTEQGALDLLMAQALSFSDNGSYDEAIDIFTELIDTAPNTERRLLAYAYYNRALSYFTLGNEEQSLSDVTVATEYYSDMHDIYLLRGTLYILQDEMERAGKDYYRRIVLLGEDTVEATYEGRTNVIMAYGDVFTFTFEAEAGDVYDFRAIDTDGSGVDALIAILDPEGNAIAGDDDTGGGVENLDSLVPNLELPTSGTYTLVVSHANGGYNGNISVRIEKEN